MAQLGNICFRPVPAQFLDGATIISSFTAQTAEFNLPAGSRISPITQTRANDAVFADINARIPDSLESETFANTQAINIQTTDNMDGTFTRSANVVTTSTREVFTLTQDYVTPTIESGNAIDFSGLNSGLSLAIWGNGNPDTPATATVVEGGDFPPIEIESVVTIEGAELESASWFTRRITDLSSVRRLEFDFDATLYNTDNSGNPTSRFVDLAAQIRFEGDTTWRRLLVGEGLFIIGDTGAQNLISVTGTADDNGRGSIGPLLETAAAPVPRISDPITGDSFQATYRLTNANFNPMRVTLILPNFNIIERSRGSVEVRFRSEQRDEGGKNRNAVRLESIKVVRIDSDESREDYIWQHRIGLNLVASATLSGTPEAVNAIITSESFYWDPDATFADQSGNEVIYLTDGTPGNFVDADGNVIPSGSRLTIHPDNATLTRNSSGNVTNVPTNGSPVVVGYWSMNNPRYQTATGHTDAAYRPTSNPAELLLTFAMGQRVNARQGAFSNNRLIWGLGLPIDRIDLDSITDWRDYCAENRLEFNGFFNENRTAFEIMDAIVAPGHGLVSWADGRLNIAIDEPYAVPSHAITESDMVAKSFRVNYEMVRKFDAVEGLYFNRDNDYQEETVRVDAESDFRSGGAVANERFFGITDPIQALNYGRRYIRHNTFRSPTEYTFNLPAQSFYLTIGDSLLIRHRLFGDGGADWHKVKVFSVSYSSNEEITVHAAPDSFRVWLDREDDIENRLIDFSNDIPLTINSQIRNDNFISTENGTDWDGQLSVIHDGYDFRISSLDRDDVNNSDVVSLNFDPNDALNSDYTRGVTSTAFEYTGFSTLEPSDNDADGTTWTFPVPLTFTVRGKNYSISRLTLDNSDSTLSITDTIRSGKVIGDYTGNVDEGIPSFTLQVWPVGQNVPAINRSLSTATLDDDGNVSITLSTGEVSALTDARTPAGAATPSEVFIRVFTGTETIDAVRSATATFDILMDADGNPILDADGNRQIANDIVNLLTDEISFSVTDDSGMVLDFNITGLSFRPTAQSLVIRSPQFVPESTTSEMEQLERLAEAGIRLFVYDGDAVPENQFLFLTLGTSLSNRNTLTFGSGQLEISPTGNVNRNAIRSRFENLANEAPAVFSFRITGGGPVFFQSQNATDTNILQSTGTTWNLFPNIEFTFNNLDFRINQIEFVDRPGTSLLRISDALIEGKGILSYASLDIRIGDTILDIGTLPGSDYRLIDTTGNPILDAMGDPVDTAPDSNTRLQVTLNPTGRLATQLQALRTQVEANRNQIISVEILGVNQPPINPLSRAMRLTQGNNLTLEMSRITTDDDGNETGRESVPLVIDQIGGVDSRNFRLNFEARSSTDSRRIRFLGDLPEANTRVEIGIPSNTTDNVKTVGGAVYETRCPVYLVTSNHARVLLARDNKDVQPMLDNIDRLAGVDTDFYAIDFYRNRVDAGVDEDGNDVSAHSIVFRGPTELATLFRTNYILDIDGISEFALAERNTSFQATNVTEGADGETNGVVFNVENDIRTGIENVGDILTDDQIQARAAAIMTDVFALLSTNTTAHVIIRRRDR